MEAMLRGSQLFRQAWAQKKSEIGYDRLTRAGKKLAYAQFRAHRNAQTGKSNSACLKATLASSRVGRGVYMVKRPIRTKDRELVAVKPATLSRRLAKHFVFPDVVAQREQEDQTRRTLRQVINNPDYAEYLVKSRLTRKRKPRAKKAPTEPVAARAPRTARKKSEAVDKYSGYRQLPATVSSTNRRAAKQIFMQLHKGQMSDSALRRRFDNLWGELKGQPYQGQGMCAYGGMLAGEPSSFY